MSVYDVPIKSLDGNDGVLADQKGKVTLVVNVASFCGLTPQYEGLEKLYERFGDQGFSVVGIPCNQFGAQEPGTADEIKTFCSTNFNVTADAEGHTGDIRWNFEKFLVSRDGEVLERFSPLVEPENADVVGAIEKALAN